MTRIRSSLLAVVCCAAFLGCADRTADTVEDEAAAPAAEAPHGVSAADVAGTWDVRAWNEAGDSLPGHTLTAVGDPASWTVTFPGRDPMPLRVSFDADSMMSEFGPYESVLRPGVQVTTSVVNRIEGDRLIGALTARYSGAGSDSVMRARTEATRTQ